MRKRPTWLPLLPIQNSKSQLGNLKPIVGFAQCVYSCHCGFSLSAVNDRFSSAPQLKLLFPRRAGMKRCPLCDFIYEDEQSLCDMVGSALVTVSGLLTRLEITAIGPAAAAPPSTSS